MPTINIPALLNTRRAVSTYDIQPQDPTPPEPHSHIPHLQGGQLADAFEEKMGPTNVLAIAHSKPEPPGTGILNTLKRLYNPPAPEGLVWLTPNTINYSYPNQSGLIALTQVRSTRTAQDGIDILFHQKVIHIPRLCRAKPIVAIANAILDGTYNPLNPFRPTCRTCAHRMESKFGAQPQPFSYPPCCTNVLHQDWCTAYRPMQKGK